MYLCASLFKKKMSALVVKLYAYASTQQNIRSKTDDEIRFIIRALVSDYSESWHSDALLAPLCALVPWQDAKCYEASDKGVVDLIIDRFVSRYKREIRFSSKS
jgi:hypothetical protein